MVAKKGIISRNAEGFFPEINGNKPIEKIKLIPNGSMRDLGNSGNVSAFHKKGRLYFQLLRIFFQNIFGNRLNEHHLL